MIPYSLMIIPSLCGLSVLTGCCASQARSEAPEDSIEDGFVLVRAGQDIRLGSAEPEWSPLYHETEQPVVIASIDEFLMARVPVTVAEFCAFLETNYAKRFGRARLCPVDGSQTFSWSGIDLVGDRFCPKPGAEQQAADAVTWHGAIEYCRWLTSTKGAKCGLVFRLPSEAEWEYAARGSEGRLWPWGSAAPDASHGWQWKRGGSRPSEPWRRTDVGSVPAGATPEGVMDMLGTYVPEWCSDRYADWPPTEQAVAKEPDTSDSGRSEERTRQWRPRIPLYELWECARSLWPGSLEESVRVARGGGTRKMRLDDFLDLTWRLGHDSAFHPARVWTRHPIPSSERAGAAVGFRIVAERSRGKSKQ